MCDFLTKLFKRAEKKYSDVVSGVENNVTPDTITDSNTVTVTTRFEIDKDAIILLPPPEKRGTETSTTSSSNNIDYVYAEFKPEKIEEDVFVPGVWVDDTVEIVVDVQTDLPTPTEGFPLVRCFLLQSSDTPFTELELATIKNHYQAGLYWFHEKTGKWLTVNPELILVTMPFTKEYIRSVAETNIPDNIPGFIFNWMQTNTEWKPRGEDVASRHEAWVLLVQGAGAYAGSLQRKPFGSNEDVSWGVVGDAVIGAWLENGDCELTIFPDYSLDVRKSFCTPEAQTGAFLHELFHAAFNAPHVHDGSSIMGSWDLWSYCKIDEGTMELIKNSIYV